MYYKFVGDTKERVLLFLHGWGADSSYFFGVANSLPKKPYSFLFVDFLGFGKSPEPKKVFDVHKYAESIIELLNELGIKKVTVVGHSFGGRVGIILASEFSKRVEKLVLVDSAGVIEGRGLGYKIKVLMFKFKLKLFGKVNMRNYGSDDYKALQSDVMRETFKNVVNESLVRYASLICCPTTIIWGEKDNTTTLRAGKILNKKIKNSKMFVILDAGHFSFLDKPEEFVYILYESIYL